MGLDAAMDKLRRIQTMHVRGVITRDELEAEQVEVLVDLASAQFTAGRKDGIERVGQAIDLMRGNNV